MTPERWRQIDQLLQAALEREPAERAALLAEACGGDDELRREVESLLVFHQRAGSLIEALPAGVAADLVADEDSWDGQTIGPYQIARAIGRGGMGQVYLARDARLGRKVALKILPWRFTRDPTRLNRFRREARTASALNHPNILTIYEIGESEGVHFIAAEFVEGRTLRALIDDGKLKLNAALDIAAQTAGALAAAHKAGIVHRDIKPENLMLRPDGYVKVLDFGLAKLSERTPATDSHVIGFPTVETGEGIVMGTVSYMSPEQARGLEVDARTDLFSLGVVLYEMIAGCQPFIGPTSNDVIAALLTAEPPPLTVFIPQIPAEMQRIVSRALAKEREERYQSAAELHDDLKHLKEELELKARLQRNDATGESRKVTLELCLGRAAQSETHQTNQAAGVIAARSISRPRELLDRFKSDPLRAVRWPAAIAAAVLVSLLAVWSMNRRLPPARNAAPISTLAVLPFKPLVAEARDEVLEMGIADSLITQLSTLKNVSVRPINAVRRYSALDQDPVAAGRALRVQAVLEGSIQKAGDKIRATVRLIGIQSGQSGQSGQSRADGKLLWTGQFDEQWTNIFAVQDAIAQRVASDLMVTLSGEERGQLTRKYTTDPEAYDLYLKGNYQWSKRTSEGMHKSVEFFRQATDKDPKYALAYVGLADAYITLGSYRLAAPKEALPLAREAAAQALEIDERLAEAHTALGRIINDYYWDWPQAEKEFQRALELKPNYPTLHDWYAIFLTNVGRFDEALSEANRALELDPLSPVAKTRIGIVLFMARRYDQAIAVLQKVLELEPKFIPARIYLGLCYSLQGRYEQALAEFQRGLAVAPNNPELISLLGKACGQAGNREEARHYQEQLNELAKHTYVSPITQAGIPAGLGDLDAAFMWLEKCFEERSSPLGALKVDPLYDDLRHDARFASLLRRVGFEQ